MWLLQTLLDTRLATAVEKLSRNTTFVSLVSIIVMVAGRVDMIIINDEETNWTLGLKIWNMTEQEQDPRVEMFHSTLNDDYLFISQNYNAHFLVVKIELRVWKHLHNHCSEVRHENKYKLKSLVTISKVFKSVRSRKLLDIYLRLCGHHKSQSRIAPAACV